MRRLSFAASRGSVKDAGCADLIKAAGVLRQVAHRQAGYMHADRFDIRKKKLAKGVAGHTSILST